MPLSRGGILLFEGETGHRRDARRRVKRKASAHRPLLKSSSKNSCMCLHER